MRSALAFFFLSLAVGGCGKTDFDNETRPKVEKAPFERAAIEYRGLQPRMQAGTTDIARDASASEEAILVTP
jgi:hypothetical protein